MASLPNLAFAHFVAREHRRPHFLRRTFGPAAAHRRNFGRRHQRRLNRNGGLRHHRAPRRRYGPGAGLCRRHNYHQHHHHVQRRHTPAGPSTRAVAPPREEVPAIPEVAAVPEVVVAVPEVVAAVPEVAAEQGVDAEYEDEASASNITAPEVKEENEDAPPTLSLPTPSPEARVLLRRFASAMAACPAGVRAGTWSPAALGLTGRVPELRLNKDAPHPSSSAEGPSRR